MTTDDDDIDDASLKSMRAVWLSMRDEDPPAAGMSGLLAAAREKADAMRAPSWWQRLFTQLRRPPALAFATVMLLVGGAVLVTRNADQKVASETADAPAEMRSRDVTRSLDEVQPPAGEDQDKNRENEPALAQPVTPTDRAPEPVRQGTSKPRPKREAAPTINRGGGGKAIDDVGPNEPNRNDRFDSEAPAKSGFAEEGKDTSTTVLESPGRVEPTSVQPPPEPTPRGQVKEASAEASVTDTGKTPPNEQLARQAESAATRGDCPAVRAIVGRLKKQDEGFYKTRLGKNAAVTKCL